VCNMELNNLYCSANIMLARLKELRHLNALGIPGICINRKTAKASILVTAI
jgi:hypothetical protein